MVRTTFTSESVTEGHPDKVCDQISDAILDAALTEDPDARVAVETLASAHGIILAGEITTTAELDYEHIVRETLKRIGYTKEHDYDPETVVITNHLNKQSPDIAQGVDKEGAGDQGLMMGYACKETPELMPAPIQLAHELTQALAARRKDGTIPYLGPDGKSQVTIVYEDGIPQTVSSVVIATQHNTEVTNEQIEKDIHEYIIEPVVGTFITKDTSIIINGTGRFVIGGPVGDAGLTGRKIIVDTYGGKGRHGGGAFSGKDPSKVDRSGAYMARHIAKNIVAAGIADECEVRFAYCIGIAEPTNFEVEMVNGKIPHNVLIEAIKATFPLTPRGIIEYLGLRKPIYKATAAYGHFGRDFPWEDTAPSKKLRETIELTH